MPKPSVCNTCIETEILQNVQAVEKTDKKKKFTWENSDCFVGLAKFKDKCQIKLKEGAIPVAKPSHKIPIGILKRSYSTS